MNLYAYILLGLDDEIEGVYSSVKSAYRDGLKMCNRTASPVHIVERNGSLKKTSLMDVRAYFKDKEKDVLKMVAGRGTVVKILKCPFQS